MTKATLRQAARNTWTVVVLHPIVCLLASIVVLYYGGNPSVVMTIGIIGALQSFVYTALMVALFGIGFVESKGE